MSSNCCSAALVVYLLLLVPPITCIAYCVWGMLQEVRVY